MTRVQSWQTNVANVFKDNSAVECSEGINKLTIKDKQTNVMVSTKVQALPRGTLRVSGKQNSLFPEGPVIKCFFIPPDSKLEKNCEKMICLTPLWLCLQYERQSNRAVLPQRHDNNTAAKRMRMRQLWHFRFAHFFWYHVYLAANFTKFDTNNLVYCCNKNL